MAGEFFSDLVTDILKRLPVKSVLRFKCVCRPWCSLINSQDFIKSHLNHSLETYTNQNLIIASDNNIYMTNLDSPTMNTIELDHPLTNPVTITQVVGSCHGLLALMNTTETFEDVPKPNNYDHSLVLYNPCTREHHMLPHEDLPAHHFHLVRHYGFGYDPINNDYKLMKLVDFKDNAYQGISKADVKVYSLKANSWKRISNLPNYICFIEPPGYYHNPIHAYGLYACSALHFRAREMLPINGTYNLVAFHLGVEEFSLIPLPDVGEDEDIIVGVFHGSLSITCTHGFAPDIESVDIWIMTEYGVKESWTKLLSVTELQLEGIELYVRPLAYSMSWDNILLEMDNYLFVWYDLETKIDELVMINDLPPIIFEAETCVGSLVSLNGRGRVVCENSE